MNRSFKFALATATGLALGVVTAAPGFAARDNDKKQNQGSTQSHGRSGGSHGQSAERRSSGGGAPSHGYAAPRSSGGSQRPTFTPPRSSGSQRPSIAPPRSSGGSYGAPRSSGPSFDSRGRSDARISPRQEPRSEPRAWGRSEERGSRGSGVMPSRPGDRVVRERPSFENPSNGRGRESSRGDDRILTPRGNDRRGDDRVVTPRGNDRRFDRPDVSDRGGRQDVRDRGRFDGRSGSGGSLDSRQRVDVRDREAARKWQSDNRYDRRYAGKQTRQFQGTVERIHQESGGYRVWISGGHCFWIPDYRWHIWPLRIGLSVSFGGFWNPLGYYNVYDYGWGPYWGFYAGSGGFGAYYGSGGYYGGGYYGGYRPYYRSPYPGYYGGSYATAYVQGYVDRFDEYDGSFVVRDDRSGRYVTVYVNGGDPEFQDLRIGDWVTLSGRWTRNGFFEAYRVDDLR